MNRNISLYGVISFLGKQADLENKLHLITPGQKLKFSVKKDFYKNKIEFKLGKACAKKLFNTPRDNVLNFGITRTKKSKTIDEERKKQGETVDTIHILGLQNFEDYSHFNPIEITIESNSIIEALSSYRKHKFLGSEHHSRASHFAFAFTTKNVSDLFSFTTVQAIKLLFPLTKQKYQF